MNRKLKAILNLLRSDNYLLVTYTKGELFFDHTMHADDTVKYSQMLIDHYDLEGQESFLLEAKQLLGD